MLTEAELSAWYQRLNFSEATRTIIDQVRRSDPARRVGGGRSNVSGFYPSRKMGVYNIKRGTVFGLANGSRQPPASDPPVAARRLPASARCLAPPPATPQRFRLRPPHSLRQTLLSLRLRPGTAPHRHRDFLVRAGKTRLRTLPPGELAHFRQLAENYRRFRQARAALVKLHQRIVTHIDRLETALQLPPPKPASRRRKR